MGPSPGGPAHATPPRRDRPPHPSTTSNTFNGLGVREPSSATPTSSSDHGDDPTSEEDDELVVHDEQPLTWVQHHGDRPGAEAAERRRSSSSALNGIAKRSNSDRQPGPARGPSRSASTSTSTTTSTFDEDYQLERRDEVAGLQDIAGRARSRTASGSGNSLNRRQSQPSSHPTAAVTDGVNGHDHCSAQSLIEPRHSIRRDSADASGYSVSRPNPASRRSSEATQQAPVKSQLGRSASTAEVSDVRTPGPSDGPYVRDIKGKGKAQQGPRSSSVVDSATPLVNDPLDPLFALSQSPSYSTFAPFGASPSFASSLNSPPRRHDGMMRAQAPMPLPDQRPPDPMSGWTPRASGTMQDTELRHYPPSYPSTESLASSAGPSSSAASFPSASSSSARPAHQPSLQQLLQTVDLGAALKLVQTLQAQQAQHARLASTVGAGTAANSAVPSAHATVEPVTPAGRTRLANSTTMIDFADVPPLASRLSSIPFPSSASSSPHPGAAPPSPVAGSEAVAKPPPSGRRVSLIGGLQRRLRAGSSAGISDLAGSAADEQQPPAPKLTERQREKALIQQAEQDETTRAFEEQVSRVYLSLSPATLRRAQNCARYLSLRYTPLFAALSAPDDLVPLPNQLEVARWRVERDEAEKRRLRQQATQMGGRNAGMAGRFRFPRSSSRAGPLSGGANGAGALGDEESAGGSSMRLSTLGGVRTGAKPSPFGPRRTKTPRVWEIYPDDIADFVAMGGKPTLPEAAQALKGGGPVGAPASQPQAGKAEMPGLTREHKRGNVSIDELFPSTAPAAHNAGHSSGSQNGVGAPSRKDEGDDLSRISSGASASASASSRPQPSRDNGLASHRSLATSDGRSSPILRPASPASPSKRPVQPRQPSYEGAPFTRSKHSFHGGDGVYPGSPLRRSISLSTGVNGRTQSPSPIDPTSPLSGPDSTGLDSDASPNHRSGSALASREDLASVTGSPVITASRHRASNSTTEALRSGISRRLDRIRGRTVDDTGGSTSALDPVDPSAQAPADSDYGARSPSRNPQPSVPLPPTGGEPTSRRQFERPHLRKNNTSVDVTRPSGFESDGFLRSSGDEALSGGTGTGAAWRRASKGILQSAWQGFKTSLDTYPDPWAYPYGTPPSRSGRGGRAALAMNGISARNVYDARRQHSGIVEITEYYDTDIDWTRMRRPRPPRQVVDLPEEDVDRLKGALRRIGAEGARVEDALPRQINTLSTYLDELSAHTESTASDARIIIRQDTLRLHASVIADIARVRRVRKVVNTGAEDSTSGSGSEVDTESDTSSSTTTRSSSHSSRASHSRSDAETTGRGNRSQLVPSCTPALGSRRNRRGHPVQSHSRHVPDPVPAHHPTRARSQTLAIPPSATPRHSPLAPRPNEVSRASGFSSAARAEPLRVLANVIRDLTRAADELDQSAREVAQEQDQVDAEINRLVHKVERAQKGIEETDYQKLRALEDHHLRLRTRLARPSHITSLVGPVGDSAAKGFFIVVRLVYLAAWPVHWVMPALRALGVPLSYSLAMSAVPVALLAFLYYTAGLWLWANAPDNIAQSLKVSLLDAWNRCSI